MGSSKIVVLRQGVHGMDVDDYAAALNERVPDRFEVEVAKTPREERSLLETASVATGLTIDAETIEAAENLELFACSFAGADHLPLDLLEEHGVTVTTASGVHGPNVAEHAIGGILAFARNFGRARSQQRRRVWRHYQADELKGNTVTIVGMGPIGQAIAKRVEPFGVETIGVRYTPEKGGPTDETIGFDEAAFNDALARTKYLVLACPLTDVTEGLIGGSELETLPPSAVIVNVARGEVLETASLVEAIRGNAIDGAALDVTDPEPLPADHPLWTFDNVLITPHNAGHTPKYWERLASIVAENVSKLDGGEFTNRVV